MSARRPLAYPLCLLAGTLLIVTAAALHPVMQGNGAEQLLMIAGHDAWRAIHWAFLFGFVLSITGLAGVAAEHAGTAGEGPARVGITVAAFAYAAWLFIVAFMAGSAATLADDYVAGDPGLAATRAVFVYDTLHPFALAAQRVGACALGIATVLLGWAVVRAGTAPAWLGWLGVAAGLCAAALAVAFRETTRADQAAYVAPVLWQLLLAVTLLARRPTAAT